MQPKRRVCSNMAKELQVISDFYDFMVYLIQRVEKFPRHHRYSLGQSIEHRLQFVLALLLRAKYTRDKTALLADANMELQTLRFQIRLRQLSDSEIRVVRDLPETDNRFGTIQEFQFFL